MARVEFTLPDVGEGLEEGEIVSWLVRPGERVTRDQPLVEVQTDKVLVELPSPLAGRVVSLACAAGDIVKVGQVLVVLDDDGPLAAPVKGDTPDDGLPAAPVKGDTPDDGVPAAPVGGGGTDGAQPAPGDAPVTAGRPKAAPAVRRLALERGVDLATVTGTGPGGRVLAADIEAAARGAAAGVGGVGWMEAGRHPLRGIRRVTAETMARSWSEIPHLTTMDEIDATGVLSARLRLAEVGNETTIGALLVAAVARGLRRYPVLNASLELSSGGPGGAIVVHAACNIGLAVATAEGLVVPVIRHADRRRLGELGEEVRRLTQAARAGRVGVSDLKGGTFTVSNYGSLGGRFATPLIRPPEVGIIGFGAIRTRPFVVDGEVRARPTLPWSLSADHRLIDGDVATAFAEYVTGLLGDPLTLLGDQW